METTAKFEDTHLVLFDRWAILRIVWRLRHSVYRFLDQLDATLDLVQDVGIRSDNAQYQGSLLFLKPIKKAKSPSL